MVLKLVDVWFDSLQECGKLRLLGNRQGLLNHVIAVLVAQQHEVLRRVLHDAINHLLIDFLRVVLQTLLDDIAAELLHRQPENVRHHFLRNQQIDIFDPEFEHKLNHIVAKRILDKNQGIFGDGYGQVSLLLRASCVDALLHDAAAVLVAGNLNTLVNHGIVQKLVVF